MEIAEVILNLSEGVSSVWFVKASPIQLLSIDRGPEAED